MKTVELILTTAASLLQEVGFEKLTTNGICQRAGLTPPALYRYFPNKYAILKELGDRLMDAQNKALEEWTGRFDEDNIVESIAELLRVTISSTRTQVAGEWIMRSLHASPVLSNVRLQSHQMIAEYLSSWICEEWGKGQKKEVYHLMRLSVEIGHAIVEMVFDETELNEAKIIEDTASLIAMNFQKAILL